MRLIILILSIFVFIETVAYGIYEFNKHKNKISAIVIYVFGLIALIAPNVMISIR